MSQWRFGKVTANIQTETFSVAAWRRATMSLRWRQTDTRRRDATTYAKSAITDGGWYEHDTPVIHAKFHQRRFSGLRTLGFWKCCQRTDGRTDIRQVLQVISAEMTKSNLLPRWSRYALSTWYRWYVQQYTVDY